MGDIIRAILTPTKHNVLKWRISTYYSYKCTKKSRSVNKKAFCLDNTIKKLAIVHDGTKESVIEPLKL